MRAGVAHDVLGNAGTFAFRVAALAGPEAGVLGGGAIGEETHILAQRRPRRAARAAEDAHGGNRIKKIAGLPVQDRLPACIFKCGGGVHVVHDANLVVSRPVRHPGLALA